MGATVRLIGNEGFRLSAGGMAAYVDAFHGELPWVAGAGDQDGPAGADLILVTHAHWDHFDQRRVADAARRTGACVVGPASVIAGLAGKLPAGQLTELEPRRPAPAGRRPAAPTSRPSAPATRATTTPTLSRCPTCDSSTTATTRTPAAWTPAPFAAWMHC